MKAARKNTENLFWFGLILCTVYLSYRYPLQINSAGTSPTYSDTPVLLQAGKFILVFPLFLIAAARCLRKSAPLKQWLIALAVLFLSTYSLSKVLGNNNTTYVEVSFWMLFSLTSVWAIDAVNISTIDRYLQYLLIYALGSTLVEVALFAIFGRLPALAFEGTYLIRFGGFLDDPNGFAAILFLLMGWSYGRFKGWPRFFIVAAIVVSLFLTQSWTGIAFMVVVFAVWLPARLSKRPLLAGLTICVIALLAGLLVHELSQLPTETFEDMLAAKQGSIEGHAFPVAESVSRWTKWALLGDSMYNAYESWWAGALVNFGAPWLCTFLALLTVLIASLRNAFARADGEARSVYLGLLLFGCYFAFGSLNLPFPTIFPINVIFFLFAFLVAFGKVQAENEPVFVSAPAKVTQE